MNAILRHAVKGHAILIDDARVFGVDPAYPTVRAIIELVAALRPDCAVDVVLDAIRIVPAAPA